MPCSICGLRGHNRRTCPQLNIVPQADVHQADVHQADVHQADVHQADVLQADVPQADVPPGDIEIIETMIIVEKCLREFVVQDRTSEIDDEQIQIYESLLNTKKKEVKLVNLENRSFSIFMVEGHSNLVNFKHVNPIRKMGDIAPRSIIPITSFTGYRYILFDHESFKNRNFYNEEWISYISVERDTDYLCTLTIEDNIPETININLIDKDLSITRLNEQNKTLFSMLKMDYLLKEIIRLGGMNNPNLEPILDLHQDIKLPAIDPIDMEAAGIPCVFTNMN